MAKIFHKKFTHISPVWLQIKVKSNSYQITGSHDIDQGWAKEVVRGGDNSLGKFSCGDNSLHKFGVETTLWVSSWWRQLHE